MRNPFVKMLPCTFLRIRNYHLIASNRVISGHLIVDFVNCGNVLSPNNVSEKVIFPNAEVVFLRNCNSKFIEDILNKEVLPELTTVYMMSCPPKNIFSRFKNTNILVYLSLEYEEFDPKQPGVILAECRGVDDILDLIKPERE